jgi:hypothetical protein
VRFFADGRLFAVDRFFAVDRLRFTCSGSFLPPVSRFHSSNVSSHRYIHPNCLRLNPSFQIFVM